MAESHESLEAVKTLEAAEAVERFSAVSALAAVRPMTLHFELPPSLSVPARQELEQHLPLVAYCLGVLYTECGGPALAKRGDLYLAGSHGLHLAHANQSAVHYHHSNGL